MERHTLAQSEGDGVRVGTNFPMGGKGCCGAGIKAAVHVDKLIKYLAPEVRVTA